MRKYILLTTQLRIVYLTQATLRLLHFTLGIIDIYTLHTYFVARWQALVINGYDL